MKVEPGQVIMIAIPGVFQDPETKQGFQVTLRINPGRIGREYPLYRLAVRAMRNRKLTSKLLSGFVTVTVTPTKIGA